MKTKHATLCKYYLFGLFIKCLENDLRKAYANKVLGCREIIDGLIKEISSIEQTWINIIELNPDFEEVSEIAWKNKEGSMLDSWRNRPFRSKCT